MRTPPVRGQLVGSPQHWPSGLGVEQDVGCHGGAEAGRRRERRIAGLSCAAPLSLTAEDHLFVAALGAAEPLVLVGILSAPTARIHSVLPRTPVLRERRTRASLKKGEQCAHNNTKHTASGDVCVCLWLEPKWIRPDLTRVGSQLTLRYFIQCPAHHNALLPKLA